MNKIILISVLVIISVSASLYLISSLLSQTQPRPVYENDFTFYDIEKIQSSLAEQDIFMSTPIAITDNTIGSYCPLPDGQNMKPIKYCTTTSLMDSERKAFGNLNIGGSIDNAVMALAIIDAPASAPNSKEKEVDIVFQTMIETLVCDCWQEELPGGFESVGAWINAAKQKHAESPVPITLKSEIAGLDNKKMLMEITSTDESYRWILIILK